VFAISNDSIDSHCRFGESLGGLEFPHLSDEDLSVSRGYGVVNDRGDGCRRSLFIVDRDGTLRHVNRAYQVNEESQYKELFEILAQLG
jgi:peroxiredoxin